MKKTANDLPTSGRTFLGGGHFGLEISGGETPEVAKAILNEAKECGVKVERLVAAVKGTKHCTDEELIKIAETAAREEVEVIICPGHLARGLIEDPNNLFTMMNYQSTEEMVEYYKEVLRCVDLGFRGFLVWRKGMLNFLAIQREQGKIPAETIFKLSTFDNNANVLDFWTAWVSGADSINCANNLSLKNLSDIRQANPEVVIDIHGVFWQFVFEKNERGRLELATKPYNRIEDAPELARICSPCLFKFERDAPEFGRPGILVYDLSGDDWTEKDLAKHKRKDVRTAAQVVKIVKEKYPELMVSNRNRKTGLRVPVI